MERFGYEVFKDYEKGDYIYKHKFRALTDYIVGNVIADYSPNRGFYRQWQHESSNLYIVARWRKNNDKPRKAKYGEQVCYTRFTIRCWDNILPCEKCVLILTLNSCLVNRKYQKMHYVFENSVFKDELTEIYYKHFLKETKETRFCNIL